MMEYLHSRILPRLDALEAETKKLETRFNCKPQINIIIESADVEKLVDAIKMLYGNFGATCNLNVNATLKMP